MGGGEGDGSAIVEGCTALAWHTQQRAWLAQNWDVSIYPSIYLFVELVKFPYMTFSHIEKGWLYE